MKKLLKNKYFLIGFIFPLVLTGGVVYGYWQTLNYLDNRDKTNYQDGWEVGYFLAQQEYGDYDKINQDKLLNQLAWLESSNGAKRKILDTNNKYSLGLYHFQADTVKDMYRRYYKQNITTEEAIAIAEDDIKATELARFAIFVKKERSHWLNSMIKLQNQGQITLK